ncbi:MAG: transcriptional repressor [Chthoniobacterales bacterium]
MAYATPQKQVIMRILETAGRPLTPSELCATAQRELPRLGIATVYRAIKTFVEEGSVRLVDVPGAPPHYEHASRQHHHFFLCKECKRLFDLVGCVRGVASLAPPGFRVESHEIVLFGDCPDCPST